jgi:hypothetical protein
MFGKGISSIPRLPVSWEWNSVDAIQNHRLSQPPLPESCRVGEKLASKSVAAQGHDAEAVKTFPFGDFISRTVQGSELRRRVF